MVRRPKDSSRTWVGEEDVGTGVRPPRRPFVVEDDLRRICPLRPQLWTERCPWRVHLLLPSVIYWHFTDTGTSVWVHLEYCKFYGVRRVVETRKAVPTTRSCVTYWLYPGPSGSEKWFYQTEGMSDDGWSLSWFPVFHCSVKGRRGLGQRPR